MNNESNRNINKIIAFFTYLKSKIYLKRVMLITNTQPANIGPQDVPRMSPSNVPRTSPKGPI